jgi:hypothetical protein
MLLVVLLNIDWRERKTLMVLGMKTLKMGDRAERPSDK